MVFRAIDERLGRQVALKILAPALAEDTAFRQRFVDESRMAASVDDPHIIPVHEAGEAAGVLFIAMRYVPGGDVRTLLQKAGPMPASRAAAIISPVASALDAAHSVGLVHRDIKPGNMLLDSRAGRPDHVYLSDFGLGKESISPSGLTQTGQILGTPAYSSPEQVEGKPLDGRADEYSLACTAFEMLTGAPPFVQTQITALILAQMSSPPPPLTSRRPDLPVATNAVFARALAKRREDRYATCREFAEDLRRAFGIIPYDSGPDIVPPGHTPTEVASLGGTRTNNLVKDAPSGATPASLPPVAADSTRGRAAEQTTPRPRVVSPPQVVTPPVQPPFTPPVQTPFTSSARPAAAFADRGPAVTAAACLFLLGSVVACGSFLYPGPLTPGTAIILTLYVIAAVLAVWLLARRTSAALAAILLGLWVPAAGFLASDFAAIAADHSFRYTGSTLASYYAGDLSDVLGVAGLIVLWSAWRSNRTAGPPGSRGGMPVILICGAVLIAVAEVVIYVSFGRESLNPFSSYDYVFGAAELVVAVVVVLIATSVRSRALGGAILLGWAATTSAVPLGLLINWSSYLVLVKACSVGMVLLLVAFVMITVIYMNQHPRQRAAVPGQEVAPGQR